MNRMGKGSDAADRSVTRRDLIVCALLGHDEDFGLFERDGQIKKCSNCQRTFRWTGKKWEPLEPAKKTSIFRVLLWVAAVIVIGVVVLLFTSCAGDDVPKVNCSSLTYVEFKMPGTVQDCGSGASILKYGGRSYPMTCGSVVSVLYDGKSFTLNGQPMTIAPGTKCDEFGGLLVTVARRSA